MGTATMLWVIMSGVGVMTAAMTKTARTAYLKFRIIQREVIRPSFERKKMSVGVSKTRAIQSSTLKAKLKYVSTVRTGLKSEPRLMKKRQAQGKTMK